MIHFILALQFLTVFPVRIKNIRKEQFAASLTYFPLVGLGLGLILAGSYRLLSLLRVEESALSGIAVVLLIILTGALHLDGLADTCDAFLSRKNRGQMLAIMRDSHIGAMGVIGLTSIILLKFSLLYSIVTQFKLPALILMCVLSRWAQVFSISNFKYAREEGKAKEYFQGANNRIFVQATLVTLCIVLFTLFLKGLFIFVAVALVSYLINKYISSKINGVTGDTIGAVSECIEVVTLFCICIIGRSG